MAEHTKNSLPAPEPFDDSEVRLKPIINTGLGILVITVISMVVVYFMAKYYVQQDISMDAPKTPIQQSLAAPQISGPQLQSLPEGEWHSLKSGWQEALHSYGWVDEANGIARLPIGEAMEMVAERYAAQAPMMSPTVDETGEAGMEPDAALAPSPVVTPAGDEETAATAATDEANHE